MILFLQTCKENIYYYSSISYLPSIPDLVSEMFAQNRNWDDMTDLPTSLSYPPRMEIIVPPHRATSDRGKIFI